MRRRLLAVALCSAAITAASACATTYDESLARSDTAVPVSSTTTTLPSGPADVLLPRLVDEASSLSTLMSDGGDEDAAVRRIEDLWTAVKAEVNVRRPDLLSAFSANVSMMSHAVQFNRAADADKAAKNLDVLAAAYLSG